MTKKKPSDSRTEAARKTPNCIAVRFEAKKSFQTRFLKIKSYCFHWFLLFGAFHAKLNIFAQASVLSVKPFDKETAFHQFSYLPLINFKWLYCQNKYYSISLVLRSQMTYIIWVIQGWNFEIMRMTTSSLLKNFQLK